MEYLELLDSEPIGVDGIGHVHSPTLREVKRLKGDYNAFLNILSLDFQQYGKITGLSLSSSLQEQVTLFDFLVIDPTARALLHKALSFFMIEAVRFDEISSSWVVEQGKDSIGAIRRDNYDDLRRVILELNHAQTSSVPPKKFRNQRAREIFEKIQREKAKAQKTGGTLTLGDIVSAMCTQSNSYNLTNIWDLTVYQLYDQFQRQSMKTQIDTTGLKWAAWGTEPFDFSVWYQTLNNKN